MLHRNSPKLYMYFIQQLNRFLHEKDPTKSILTEKERSQPTKKSTKVLLSKLKLSNSEVVLASYPCKMKRDLRSGILAIFTDFVIVASFLFGHISNQNRVLLENISNFQLHTDHCLEIVLLNEQSITLQMSSPQHVSEALQLLSVLVEQNHRKIEKATTTTTTTVVPHSNLDDFSMEFNSQDWEIVNSFAEIIELDEGDIVEEQDVPCCSLYRVRSGLFCVTRKTVSRALADSEEEAKIIKVTDRIVGQFFGAIGFVFGGVSSAKITAKTDASCWKFSQENIDKLIVHHPVLGAKLYRALSCDLLAIILKQQTLFENVS